MVRFDWFLAKNQSGCCRFDPCFLKGRLCFYKGLNLKNRCLALLFVKYKNFFLKCFHWTSFSVTVPVSGCYWGSSSLPGCHGDLPAVPELPRALPR